MHTLIPLAETRPDDPAVIPLDSHLALSDRPDPQPGPGQVVIRVFAAGVNRADLAQSRGHYAPPAGAPVPLGLECAGIIAAVGLDVHDLHEGDAVCALVPGGACAELCVADRGCVLPLPLDAVDSTFSAPAGFSALSDPDAHARLIRERAPFALAATLVEAATTAWLNLVEVGGISPDPAVNIAANRAVLIHGGTGSIGTVAIQIARTLGCRVLATAGSRGHADACIALGAHAALDRHEDVPRFVAERTDGRGVDVILDVTGADALGANLRSLARGGVLAVIGLLGGDHAELDLAALLSRCLTVRGTTLRSQPLPVKTRLCQEVTARVWPMVRDGHIRPVLGGVWALDEAAAAHDQVLHRNRIGSHVLLP